MLRLLVADDNPITLDFLAAALRTHGWHVTTAADGALAAALAAGTHFDVLLLDARMPKLDGPAALASIRASEGLAARAPALATTASPDRTTRDILLAAGFDAVLQKPISIADLGDALRPYEFATDSADDGMFDEARAHGVGGGDPAIVKALRGLLLAELERLPGELALMSRQMDACKQLDTRLHKLAASAGFCGAVALENAVRTMDAARQRQAEWPESDVAVFSTRCEKIAEQLRKSSDV